MVRKRIKALGFLALLSMICVCAIFFSPARSTRDDRERSLIFAASVGETETVRRLLEQGVDPNCKNDLITQNLHPDFFERVRSLLTKPVPPFMTNTTPLVAAIMKQQTETAKVLLDHGASPAVRDEFGYTPLTLAAEHHNFEVSEMLVAHGADVNQPDSFGKTPLIVASECGSLRIVSILLKHHADVGLRDKRGFTALQLARQAGVIHALKNAGASRR